MVQHRTECDKFMVRTRTKGDLERLAVAALYDELEIVEDEKADYRWRAAMPKHTFTMYMIDSLGTLDYTTNVKGTIDCDEPKRHTALMRCWSAMMTLQEGGAYSPSGRLPLYDYYSGNDRWDDPDYDPLDYHDAEDMVDVVPHDDGYAVRLYKATGDSTIVNVFTSQDDADDLARRIRDVAYTWDGFYDPDLEDAQ